MRSGICLRGPLHGQMLTSPGEVHRVPLRSTVPPIPRLFMDPTPTRSEIKIVTYIWHRGLKIGDDTIVKGFWVPETESFIEALRDVFRGLTA